MRGMHSGLFCSCRVPSSERTVHDSHEIATFMNFAACSHFETSLLQLCSFPAAEQSAWTGTVNLFNPCQPAHSSLWPSSRWQSPQVRLLRHCSALAGLYHMSFDGPLTLQLGCCTLHRSSPWPPIPPQGDSRAAARRRQSDRDRRATFGQCKHQDNQWPGVRQPIRDFVG